MEGDVKNNIETFASKYGVKAVAQLSSALLALACVAAIGVGVATRGLGMFQTLPMVSGHTVFLTYFIWSYKCFDSASMTSLKRFYKSIWNLFYLEYCLYPFI